MGEDLHPMPVLVRNDVTRTLLSMAVPMLAGTFAMNAYNLTDTWFVSRLGTLPLAAMGFTFPVVMFLRCVARGIGSGVTTLVSHAMGREDGEDARTLSSHGILLTMFVTFVMAFVGWFTIDPLFRMLGARGDLLVLVGQYMKIWYLGAFFMTLPMVGNGILISVGDARAASRFMMLGTLLNVLLDPIMIFGFLAVPAMGIRGAAWATILAQAVAAFGMLRLLRGKHDLLRFELGPLAGLWRSARRIARFAVPNTFSMILMPVSAAVITRLLSRFGHEAVAASGAAGRLEMFAFMVPMALGISLTPFISQNFGAGRIDRIQEAHRVSSLFALAYGALMAGIFSLAAPLAAALFTKDPKVAVVLVDYMRIISIGYGMMEVHRYGGFFLAGMHRPMAATALNGLRVLVFLLPLSYLGAEIWGLRGVFAGRLATDLVVGSIGLLWAYRSIRGTRSMP